MPAIFETDSTCATFRVRHLLITTHTDEVVIFIGKWPLDQVRLAIRTRETDIVVEVLFKGYFLFVRKHFLNLHNSL